MVFTLLLYGYVIVGSIFLDDLKDSLETNGNITCYLNPLGSKLSLYPQIAIGEFILLNTFFHIYPFRFLSLNHEKLSLPLAFSIPFTATSVQIYIYVMQGTLCRKEPLEMLHYKFGLKIETNVSFPTMGMVSPVNVIFLLSVSIRFIFWLFGKINNFRTLNNNQNGQILSNNSQPTATYHSKNISSEITKGILPIGSNLGSEIVGTSNMCENDTDYVIKYSKGINETHQTYNTKPAVVIIVKPINRETDANLKTKENIQTNIKHLSQPYQNPIFTLNVGSSSIAGFHETPVQSRKTNFSLGSLSDKFAGPFSVIIVLAIALLSSINVFREEPTQIKSYIFSMFSDWVLLVVPTYWVMCVKDVTDLVKLKIHQLRVWLGY